MQFTIQALKRGFLYLAEYGGRVSFDTPPKSGTAKN